MKIEPKALLAARLKTLHCERVPDWLQARLLPLIEAEARIVEAKAEQQLQRRIARALTVKSVAAAFIAGPPANTGEGLQGEGATLALDQQGLEAQRALAKCAAKPVVGHPHA